MKTVWKYILQSETTFDIPKDALLLHVDVQGRDICLWAMVDTEKETEKRHFIVAGTGHEIKQGAIANVGSVMLESGTLVFHVFETWDTFKQPQT